MINRDTIWHDTYRRNLIYVDGSSIEVFTAIHHYTGTGKESRLDLCAELILRAENGPASFIAEFNLSADQMEMLAAHLSDGAQRVRHLQAMLDEESAQIEAGVREAIRQAKEAA